MSKRILVIDDDRDHAESIADVLTARGIEVELAFTGEAGISRFRAADFDMVLMDVKLPGKNGVETFFEFRKIRPDARVMLMTGYSLEHLIAQAVDKGALGVLRKPFAVGDLLNVLDRVKPCGMVLVADDDPDFAASIRPILMQHGYRVEIATTGQQALEKAGIGDVSCLVLDLAMPVLSGLEVYWKLKDAGRAIPTIFVTGMPGEKSAAEAQLRSATAQGMFLKPFDPAELLRAVDLATGCGDARPTSAS